jgi:hypothetical protein
MAAGSLEALHAVRRHGERTSGPKVLFREMPDGGASGAVNSDRDLHLAGEMLPGVAGLVEALLAFRWRQLGELDHLARPQKGAVDEHASWKPKSRRARSKRWPCACSCALARP